MKPFNLEKALAGEPVLLCNGSKAYVLHQFKNVTKHLKSLLGYKIYKTDEGKLIESSLEWFADGSSGIPTYNTIIGMWEEPKPKRFINGIEVPDSLNIDNLIDGKRYWFVEFSDIENVSYDDFYESSTIDKKLISQKLVFETKEGAEAMAKALLNYKVEIKNE